jgi:ubiquinone/menaquinone biosynthesis C-methylase UbiE
VGDARHLALPETFDLALAAYLLNYARDRAELQTMCSGVARCLKPGGRFVTVNSSPALNFPAAPSYRKYGFETQAVGPFQEGAPITWTFYLEKGSFSIENYYLDLHCHEEAFRSAGFREVRWHAPRLSPAGEAAYGKEFWACLLEHPPITFIECVR